MSYSIGSLFDGSGGFPLAGTLCGIEPRWASEVEPYPIAVTRSRFPSMKHLGDISKVNGAEIEPVDVITFGSPCQDLSVAGKQAGMKHQSSGDSETTRSGLFIEAVRIIKEMRRATNDKYPKFAIWENVPGAFSSNKGEDFRTVLQEIIQIVEPSAPPIPAPEKGGWPYSDVLVGDGWSVAYRVFDAQYWGVPQRRRRIFLVADFTGECAEKVLFEREGLRGYFAESGTKGQGNPADAGGGPGATDRESTYIIDSVGGQAERGWLGDKAPTLKAVHYKFPPCVTVSSAGFCAEPSAKARGIGYQEECAPTLRAGVTPACCFAVENHPNDSRVNIDDSGKCQTLTSRMGTGGDNVPMVMEPFCKSRRAQSSEDATTWKHGDVANTLNTFDTGESRANELVVEAVPIHDQATRHMGKRGANTDGKGNGLGVGKQGDPMNTLTSGDRHAVVYALDRASFNQGRGAQYDFEITDSGINSTIVAKGPSAVAYSMKSIARNGKVLTEQANPICASDYKDPDVVAFAANQRDEVRIIGDKAGAVQAQPGMKQQTFVAESPHYIVRRLTPTECARLQGFPDWWGHVEPKDTLTESERRFWQDVRNTHAAINGKTVKEYTEGQMLTWYNKLHSDSAEYKMWGNGLALPPTLYVMQGIADALKAKTM